MSISVEWEAALSDAGIPADRCRLYLCDGTGGGESSLVGAVWHRPGASLVVDPAFPNAGQLSDANDPAHINLHRIVLWRDHELPVLGGLMRHELEHARQWDVLGTRYFDLIDLVERGVLPHKAGGLDGCAGALINAAPAEQDANAAAAMYLRSRHPEAIPKILLDQDRRQLACSLTGPGPRESLPTRTVAFLAQFPAACAAVAAGHRTGADFPTILEAYWAGAGKLWHTLTEPLAG
jgi:hypothetical protein